MYYKVIKGTETFEKLEKVWAEMKKCNEEAVKLAEELGFTKLAFSKKGVAGGIFGLASDEIPDGYKRIGPVTYGCVFPKKNNKEAIFKIESLPIVTHTEYNDVIGFKEGFTDTHYSRHYGSRKEGDVFLIEVSNGIDYTPKEDMTEITFTEYNNLIIKK